MIKFVEDKKTFILNGKNYSYIIYIDNALNIENLYFGKKIDENNLSYLYSLKNDFDVNNKNYESFFTNSAKEISTYGRGDYSNPSILIERLDGSYLSRFKYKTHNIKNETVNLLTLPHVRYGGTTLTITLVDDFSDTQIDLNYTIYDEYDTIVRNVNVKNIGNDKIYLKRAFSFNQEFINGEFNLLKLYGYWASERNIEIEKVKHGIEKISSNRGISSNVLNPFIALLKDNANEFNGDVYGYNLIYSGSYSMEVEKTFYNATRITGGINDFCFSHVLLKDEVFETPQVLLSYSSNGLNGLSNDLHNFIRENIINPNYKYQPRPIVVNNWEATYFNFNNKILMDLIDKASEIGADTFVLDDGWFGHRNQDNSSLGDWFINDDKFDGDIDIIISYANSKNLNFGLWFEPEMISKDSVLYKEHPDYAINYKNFESAEQRNQYVLDLTRDDVIDNIYNQMYKILSKHNIKYVKWDMNRSLTENFGKQLSKDEQGSFNHRYTLGLYKLINKVMTSFPNILFEGCASGGARFDLGMLYYFPQIWTSDNTDAFERCKIQYGTSIAYPLSSMSCHISACPNHQMGRITPFDTRSNIAFLGPFGFELDLTKEDDNTLQLSIQKINEYKKISNLILKGDLYRLKSPFDSNYFSVIVVSKEQDRALFIVQKLRADLELDITTIKLIGLDKDKKYYIEELAIEASGEELLNHGLNIKLHDDYSSLKYNLIEIK